MTTTRRAALLALLPLPALAQGQGHGRGNQGGGRGNQGGGGASLGGTELAIIRTWLGANPGFAAQPLPPGMRNRLERGKPLPPGIARRALPPTLLGQLPARPGYQYGYIGGTVVLIEIATGVVAGLLADALLR